MNESPVVEEYDFIEPDFHEIDYLLDDIIEDCRNKYFQTFECRLVYDNKFTNNSSKNEVNFPITHRSMEFKSKLYCLN